VRVVDEDRAGLLARLAGEERERSFAAGVERGRELALTGAAGALEQALSELDAARALAADALARQSVELAVAIARTLLRVEIDAGHYDLEKIVREALATSGIGRGSCVVHLNPIDAERLKHVPFRAGTLIEADVEVSCGDVHVTTPHGVLVRDIDDALESITERIRGGLT